MTRVKVEGKHYYVIHCDGEPKDNPDESCLNKVPDTEAARRRARKKGWYFSKDNKTAYCPDCLPEWVIEWRKKNKKK